MSQVCNQREGISEDSQDLPREVLAMPECFASDEQLAFVRMVVKASNVQAVFVVRGCVLMRQRHVKQEIAA